MSGLEFDVNKDPEASQYQGASIRDCYADIKTVLTEEITNNASYIGGAFGKNTDYQDIKNGEKEFFEQDENHLVINNYIIGV